MAQTVDPQAISNAMARHLQPGELLRNAVYGQEVPTQKMVVYMLGSAPLALIPYFLFGPFDPFWVGMLWLGMWVYPVYKISKFHLLALTDRRLILVGIQMPILGIDLNKQTGVTWWPLSAPPRIQGSPGRLAAKIAILDPQRPASLKTSLIAQHDANRQVEAIVAALSGTPAPLTASRV
jgi:hypothetical protein